MKITLDKLAKYFYIDKLIYHSVDLSLYIVSVVIDNQEYYIVDQHGSYLKATNLIELQQQLSSIKSKETVLRHSSPYDEMIGGPEKTENILEVPLADNQLY
jgi:hypothetical protein